MPVKLTVKTSASGALPCQNFKRGKKQLDNTPNAHYNNLRWSAGAVAQWERASLARKRPGVRIPPAPPGSARRVNRYNIDYRGVAQSG